MTVSVQALLPTSNEKEVYPQYENEYDSRKRRINAFQERSDACCLIRNSSDVLIVITLEKLLQSYLELSITRDEDSCRRELVVPRLKSIRCFLNLVLQTITVGFLIGNESSFRKKSAFVRALKKSENYEIYYQACICLKEAIDERMIGAIREHMAPFMTILMESF